MIKFIIFASVLQIKILTQYPCKLFNQCDTGDVHENNPLKHMKTDNNKINNNAHITNKKITPQKKRRRKKKKEFDFVVKRSISPIQIVTPFISKSCHLK